MYNIKCTITFQKVGLIKQLSCLLNILEKVVIYQRHERTVFETSMICMLDLGLFGLC